MDDQQERWSPEVVDDLWRGLYHLPAQQDMPITILKGHLCAEVLLRKVILSQVTDGTPLDDARLSFHQVLCLAQAMASEPQNGWLWEACARLNRLRNAYAHDIDTHSPNNASTKRRVEEFVEYTEEHSRYPFSEESLKHYTRLDLAVRAVYCGLLVLVHKLPSK